MSIFILAGAAIFLIAGIVFAILASRASGEKDSHKGSFVALAIVSFLLGIAGVGLYFFISSRDAVLKAAPGIIQSIPPEAMLAAV